MLRRAPLLLMASALVAFAGVAHAGAGTAPTTVAEIGRALPQVADLRRARLQARTQQQFGGRAARAPFPCAARGARGLPATARWGEWAARGRGRSVRVLTSAYTDSSITRAWRSLRRAVQDCP